MCPAVLGMAEAEAVEVEGETGTLGVTLQKYVVISILLFISLEIENLNFAFHFSMWCQSFFPCFSLRACIIEESILLKSERQSWFHRTLLPACLILFFAGTASSIYSSFSSGTSSEACISIRLSSVNSPGAV